MNHHPKWWQRLARNAALQLAGRVAMLIAVALCTMLVAQAKQYTDGLKVATDNMAIISTRLSAVESVVTPTVVKIDGLSDRVGAVERVVSPVPNMSNDIDSLLNRMTASETRGNAAREDRERQFELLNKIIEQQSAIIAQQAATTATLSGIDKRLERLETKGE